MQFNLSILAAFMVLATSSIAAPGPNQGIAVPFRKAATDLFEARSVDGGNAVCKNGGHNCGSVCCPKGIPCLGTHSCSIPSENSKEVAREPRSVDITKKQCQKENHLWCGKVCCPPNTLCYGTSGCRPPPVKANEAAREVSANAPLDAHLLDREAEVEENASVNCPKPGIPCHGKCCRNGKICHNNVCRLPTQLEEVAQGLGSDIQLKAPHLVRELENEEDASKCIPSGKRCRVGLSICCSGACISDGARYSKCR